MIGISPDVPDNSTMGPRARRIRMSRSRGVLIAGAIVVCILVVEMVTSIAGAVIADRGTDEAARDTYSYVGDLMSVRVATMADSASDVVRGTVAEIQRAGELEGEDALLPGLADRLERETAVGSIFVGRPDGTMMLLARSSARYTRLDVAPVAGRDGQATFTRTEYDSSLRELSTSRTTGAYSVTSRPWYRLAVGSSDLRWTDPYISARTGEIVVAPTEAVRLAGEVVAVVGADLDLDQLGTLLDDIPIGEDAHAFILSGDGRVVAAPQGSRAAIRALAEESGDVPDATRIGLPTAAPQVGAGDGDVFRTDGDVVILSRRLDPSTGLDWVLHLEADAADLAPGLHRFKSAALAIAALSIVMVAIAAGFALRIWRPIRAMGHRASTDALTGLANRYEFARRAREAVRASEETGGLTMLVALDLDHFKSLNDTGGHEAGDRVLAAVGEALLASVRQRDVAARLGGDEFVAVVTLGERGSPFDVATRLRDHVEGAIHALSTDARVVGVTAGYATTLECGHDLRAMERMADEALIAGKRERKGGTYGPVGGPHGPARRPGAAPVTVEAPTEEVGTGVPAAAGSLPGD